MSAAEGEMDWIPMKILIFNHSMGRNFDALGVNLSFFKVRVCFRIPAMLADDLEGP